MNEMQKELARMSATGYTCTVTGEGQSNVFEGTLGECVLAAISALTQGLEAIVTDSDGVEYVPVRPEAL